MNKEIQKTPAVFEELEKYADVLRNPALMARKIQSPPPECLLALSDLIERNPAILTFLSGILHAGTREQIYTLKCRIDRIEEHLGLADTPGEVRIIDIPEDECRNIIIREMRSAGGSRFVSDIAFKYNLDVEFVSHVMHKLEMDGVIRKSKS